MTVSYNDTPVPFHPDIFGEVDQAAQDFRFRSEFERTAQAKEPLTDEQLIYLFELDKPLYKRTRDDWYDYDDPDEAQKAQYHTYKSHYNEQARAYLFEQYGPDAEWMVLSYGQIVHDLDRFIPTAVNPTLLYENLEPAHRVPFIAAFQARGVEVDIVAHVQDGLQDGSQNYAAINQLIRQNWDACVEGGVSHYRLLSSFENAVEIVGSLAKLAAAGIAQRTVVAFLPPRIIEQEFSTLLAEGYEAALLAEFCSPSYVNNHFDELYDRAPDALVSQEMTTKGSVEDRVERILCLYHKGAMVYEHLGSLLTNHPVMQPKLLERLVDGGIAADYIADALPEDYVHMYTPWLVENGATPARIEARMSDYAALLHRETLREAGIEVDVPTRLRAMHPIDALRIWNGVATEAGDVTLEELVAAMDCELSENEVRTLWVGGVDPKLFIEKLPDGFIGTEVFYGHMQAAGVSSEVLWRKTGTRLRRAILGERIQTGAALDAEFVKKAVSELQSGELIAYLSELAVDEECVGVLYRRLRAEHTFTGASLELLLERGLLPGDVLFDMTPNDALRFYVPLINKGVPVERLYDIVAPYRTKPEDWKFFLAEGISVEQLLTHVPQYDVERHFTEYSKLGANLTILLQKVGDIQDYLRRSALSVEWLLQEGVAADMLALSVSFYDFQRFLPAFTEAGVDSRITLTRFLEHYKDSTNEEVTARIKKALGEV